MGAVGTLLLSEDLRKTRARIVCTNASCDFSEEATRSSEQPASGDLSGAGLRAP